MTRLLLVVGLLLGIGSGCTPDKPVLGQLRAQPAASPTYEVLAVRYGHLAEAPRKTWVRQGGNTPVTPVLSIHVLRGDGRTILVDTGTSRAADLATIGGTLEISPVDALAEVGIAPADVTDIVLTTYRRDRVADLNRYPNATVWMQAPALAAARARMYRRGESSLVKKPTIDTLESLQAAGRLERIELSFEFLPGIQSHTGSLVHQWYSWHAVRSGDGVVVLAGEVAPLWRNIGKRQPAPGQSTRHTENTIDTMNMLVDGRGRIIPGLEPHVFDTSERLSEHVARVAAKGPP